MNFYRCGIEAVQGVSLITEVFDDFVRIVWWWDVSQATNRSILSWSGSRSGSRNFKRNFYHSGVGPNLAGSAEICVLRVLLLSAECTQQRLWTHKSRRLCHLTALSDSGGQSVTRAC